MISTEIFFKVIVLLGLIRASRYSINSSVALASIWFIARFASGFFDGQELWINVIKSIIGSGFASWMFNLIKRYDKWSSQWIGVCGVGILILCVIL